MFKTMKNLAVAVLLGGLCGTLAAQQAAPSTGAKEAYSTSKPGKSEARESASPDAARAVPVAQAPVVAGDEIYRVGIEDDLQISVWREPELSVQVVVRPDGMITMPLLNEVKVIGLTTNELKDMLTEKLRPFLTEPQVTVIVRGIKSRRVFLVGNVAKTGAFPLNGRRTVMQLLAEAGGLSPFAKSDGIYVLRTAGERQERLNFNYKKALKGEGNQDFFLMPGDMIVVP